MKAVLDRDVIKLRATQTGKIDIDSQRITFLECPKLL